MEMYNSLENELVRCNLDIGIPTNILHALAKMPKQEMCRKLLLYPKIRDRKLSSLKKKVRPQKRINDKIIELVKRTD